MIRRSRWVAATPEQARSRNDSAHENQPPRSTCSQGKSSPRGRQRDLELVGWHCAQDVCPWNVKFATEPSEPAFAAKPAVAGKDARSLALELLAMSQSEFAAAFKGSPMKRAKLRGLRRNAAVVLGNAGAASDVPALIEALSDPEPLVRLHVAWAMGRIGSPSAVAALRRALGAEAEEAVASLIGAALVSTASGTSPRSM